MPKPTKFTAVSPFTGAEFTRKSHRAYTHAVILHTPVEALRAGLEAEIATQLQWGDRYRLIAEHLEQGTEPEAGSPLLGKPSGTSYNEQKAGVRTVWDQIRYQLEGRSPSGPISAAALAEQYRGYEADVRARVDRLDPAAIVEPREGASFHHSLALAQKAAGGIPGTAVVEVR